ncbi:MAG: LacI family transcriptional regulator [Verrucomicrobia bacterium]|nr:LacI family transcriptional regulator [Verrucomicrobiota bacterium]
MQQPRRATLRDVAQRARLSLSAVSLALRRPAALPPATVARVRRAAAVLGYTPDPALSALAAYRSARRVHRDFAVIALVSNWARREDWFRRASAQALWEGATTRARALGYSLQHLWAREDGATPARFGQILLNRGIRGLILAPFEDPEARFDLPWEHFAVVAVERPARHPRFHHVVPGYFADLLLVWDQMRRRGYRRIGLVLDHGLAERAAHQWEAAHAFEQQRGSATAVVPTCVIRGADGGAGVLGWLRRHRPDAIVSRSDLAFPALRAAGVRFPADLGYASLNVVDDAPGVSGILQPREVMGAAAVDALNAQLLVSQLGPGPHSLGTQVDGVWHEGATLRPLPA